MLEKQIALISFDYAGTLLLQTVETTGWVKKKWDLKKYVYCSEGHKNQANQILILCMFFSTLGHLV